MRIWITRTLVSIAIFFVCALAFDWRLGLSLAVIYATADTVYRSKTTAIIPAHIRVTSAQRRTRRRLRLLRPAGYMALHARRIAGTESIIDHLVVGPAGVFSIDSERWDRRLPISVLGGKLYHGPAAKEERLDHAQEEADQAAALIAAELRQPVQVQPVMIIYGPVVPWIIATLKGINVLHGRHIGTFFRRRSRDTRGKHLNSERVAKILAAAADALPPLR